MGKAKRKPKPHPWGDRFNFYPCPYFTLCLNERQFKRVLEHIEVTEPIPFLKHGNAHATTRTFVQDKGRKLVCVVTMQTKGRSMAAIAGLIAHEAMHILDEAWDDAGEKEPSSELKAYAIQHIVTHLLYLYDQLKPR